MVENNFDISERVKCLRHIWNEREGALIGRLPDSTPIALPEKYRTGHVQVIGSTGRGKTESIIFPWLMRDVLRGHSAILIDGKGDLELAERIQAATAEYRPEYKVKVFNLDNEKTSIRVNPLKNGSPQQIVDRIFASFDFEDPFYKGLQYEAVMLLTLLLRSTGEALSFESLYAALTADEYTTKLISKCPDDKLKYKVRQFLETKKLDRQQNLMGITTQLAPFAFGELAGFVNGSSEATHQESNPSDIILSGNKEVLVILLPTLKYQTIGKSLGRLLLQDLAWSVGERSSRKSPNPFTPVFLDEFSAFAYDGFQQVLNKARSANVALHLSHQSLGDLSAVSEDFAKTVNTNTNIKCILGVNDPDTADFFARHIGTDSTEKVTERAQDEESWFQFKTETKRTGDKSIRTVESYRVHPNELKNFTAGRGAIHVPTPDGFATEVIQFARFGDEDEEGQST